MIEYVIRKMRGENMMKSETNKKSIKLAHRDVMSLFVSNCGFERCVSLHSWGPAMRDHYLIHYITSGKGYYKSKGKTYTLTQGDGFIAFPGDIIYYYADEDEPWSYCWVGFNGTDAENLVSKIGFSERNLIFHYDKDHKLEQYLNDMCKYTSLNLYDELRRQAQLLMFLSTIVKNSGSGDDENSNEYDYISQATYYIENNYFYNIHVEDIASHIGISRSHLYRLFSQHFNCSPSTYLTRLRIDRACELLKSKKLTVGETAYSTGFTDQLYFSRVFKKQIGMPPRQYVKQLNEKND